MTQPTTTHASFTIERHYSSDRAEVFRAFSDPTIKQRWFAEGPGFQLGSYTLDFRIGGRETSTFRVDSPGFSSDEIRYDAYIFDLVEGFRLTSGYSMSNVGVPFSASLMTITLESVDGGTRLVHTEHVAFFDGSDGVAMRESGTRQLLERLAEELGEAGQAVIWGGAGDG